jgi:hypothetical protein
VAFFVNRSGSVPEPAGQDSFTLEERRRLMNAREKLNDFWFGGAALAAIFVGLATGSWAAFFCTLAVVLIVAVCLGGFRPDHDCPFD